MKNFWFDDLPVLGNMHPSQAAIKLREVGENIAAAQLASLGAMRSLEQGMKKSIWPFQDKPWQHTAHTFGYVSHKQTSELMPIKFAGNIQSDLSLKNSHIKITLNKLRVAKYPGRGIHNILFDFYAQNQLPSNKEHLHFNAKFKIKEGEHASIIGYPIFIGLRVGLEGVSFKCFTVNIGNENDISFLKFLESDTFKEGLRLISKAQPAVKPFSHMAYSITRGLAQKKENIPVQNFYMGLDFNTQPTGACLTEGAYIAVQIPETYHVKWNWDEWVYNSTNGHIVRKDKIDELIPFNYIVFGVSRMQSC